MHKILIIGATSAIAQATATYFAADGNMFFLVARNQDRLQIVTDDLKARGANQVSFTAMDVNEFDRHEPVIQEATESMHGLNMVLIAHGTLGDQKVGEKDYHVAEEELKTNLLSTISLCTILANQFESQRHGTLAVITSVAGDRGRQSNYIYGTAQGAKSIFLQGLRNRLSHAGVQVLTIKPGFIDTPMTAHLKKGLLFVKPEVAGKAIYHAIIKNKDIAYVPSFWWFIMTVIKLIPEGIFKRLRL
ncbi:MAG: short-chain dehydrogenase [Anaerolineaceae bacterium 4572_78]|nr:MAG: short-chain dehydrogenase [Anaerolineaceae bacterium 4572_78]